MEGDDRFGMDKIRATTAREFLIMHARRLAEFRKDAQTMSAAAFRRKNGVPPQEYRQRIGRLKELAKLQGRGIDGRGDLTIEPLRGGEFHELSRFFLVIWSRDRT
jgi:hypothetical protein